MNPLHHIFIAGLHRSGTSLVEQFMYSRLCVSALRAQVPENEGQHLQDVYPVARAFGGAGRFAFAPEMHPLPPDADAALRSRQRLLQCWMPYVTGSDDTLVEKSPPNLTKIPWLRAVFPGSRFLIVVRDPRAVSLATQKRTGASLEELLFHWHTAYAAAHTAMDDDCVVIRYEDFCADPAAFAERLCARWNLRGRPVPLPVKEKFSAIANVNPAYLPAFPARKLGPGIWTEFGYRI